MILETALYVSDLDVSERFYRDLLNAETMLADERMRALALPGRQVLLLFVRGGSVHGDETEGGRIPGHDAQGLQHLCFRSDDPDARASDLERLGIAVESRVEYPDGGKSIYLRDPDGHSVEFGTESLWPWPANG